MGNEAPHGPSEKGNSGNDAGGSGDEHSPLCARAAFIENWSWELIVSLNRGACERGRAQHGYNRETHQRVQTLWEETRPKELTLLDLLELLFRCHRQHLSCSLTEILSPKSPVALSICFLRTSLFRADAKLPRSPPILSRVFWTEIRWFSVSSRSARPPIFRQAIACGPCAVRHEV